MPNLLLELGTEELPARFVRPALQQLAQNLERALAEVLNQAPVVTTLGSHRRLTAFIGDLPSHQPASEQVVVGPPAQVAFGPQGEPTRAALGFARAQGVQLEDLEVQDTPRGRYLCARKRTPGRPTAELLAGLLPSVVGSISFPKAMHWHPAGDSARGAGVEPSSGVGLPRQAAAPQERPRLTAFRFARPIRYLLALLDEDILPVEVAGLEAGRTTRGHPFLAPGEISLARADLSLYLEQLAAAYVVADDGRRQQELRQALTDAARRHGGEFREEELLEEVTFLVELVNVIEGRFPAEYLQLPREVLEAAMKSHQRYFPVHDASGNLVDRFLIASNRLPEADEAVRAGNERVLVARLFDAKFFYAQDLSRPLRKRLGDLEQLIFQETLGSYREKTHRLVALARHIARQVPQSGHLEAAVADAAELAKVDLVSSMVTEFPELQGIMGREYARAQGVADREVADAIGEQYLPRRADDPLPSTLAGAVLALADRLDTLAGYFAIGLLPTGTADPYALRRAAVGVLRILMESERSVPRSLRELLTVALEPFRDKASRPVDQVLSDLLDFFRDRLSYLLLEQGHPLELVRAVLSAGFDDPREVVRRLEALRVLAGEPGWRDLVKAVERTHNITRDYTGSLEVSPSLLQEPEERTLYALYQEVAPEVGQLLAAGNYLDAARTFARTLAQPLHVFFEKVFVNVEEEALRRNRLALLKAINQLISTTFADLAQVHVE